jgi:hypothetical protein
MLAYKVVMMRLSESKLLQNQMPEFNEAVEDIMAVNSFSEDFAVEIPLYVLDIFITGRNFCADVFSEGCHQIDSILICDDHARQTVQILPII